MLRTAALVVLLSVSSVVARASTFEGFTLTSPVSSSEISLKLMPGTIFLADVESKNVNVTTTPDNHNYMLTIAANIGGGALVGFLIGGAIYLMQEPGNRKGVNLAWWTGGGAIVGAVAGVIQIVVTGSRDTKAVSDLDDRQAPAGPRVLAWGTNF